MGISIPSLGSKSPKSHLKKSSTRLRQQRQPRHRDGVAAKANEMELARAARKANSVRVRCKSTPSNLELAIQALGLSPLIAIKWDMPVVRNASWTLVGRSESSPSKMPVRSDACGSGRICAMTLWNKHPTLTRRLVCASRASCTQETPQAARCFYPAACGFLFSRFVALDARSL